MPAPEDGDAGRPRDSAPCIGCDLCCNGVLHDHVILAADGHVSLRVMGVLDEN